MAELMTELEQIDILRERVRVLEAIVNTMAGYVDGFGTSGVTRATMSARRKVPAPPPVAATLGVG